MARNCARDSAFANNGSVPSTWIIWVLPKAGKATQMTMSRARKYRTVVADTDWRKSELRAYYGCIERFLLSRSELGPFLIGRAARLEKKLT